ncbi:TetR/AcrR family transcriptional regulator [Nocardia sp. NPDC059239]|uniref:TetR/AcrR family transcriptional regulator n=1 Tax=unclassified Nocardia TaxID=2637762 RepID=UPI0036C8F7BE
MTAEADSRGRARRPIGQARQELIEAARKTFIEVGYHGASLRQIATQANTTQAMLYRYFPSKAELFEHSVLHPFEEFLAELVRDWQGASTSTLPTRELIAGFTQQLYDFTRTHRGIMLTLIAADAHDDDSLGNVKASFIDTINNVVTQALAERKARGWDDIDVEVAAPATMAMIIASALLDDWLFPDTTTRPNRDRILAELTRYEVRAIVGEHQPVHYD